MRLSNTSTIGAEPAALEALYENEAPAEFAATARMPVFFRPARTIAIPDESATIPLREPGAGLPIR